MGPMGEGVATSLVLPMAMAAPLLKYVQTMYSSTLSSPVLDYVTPITCFWSCCNHYSARVENDLGCKIYLQLWNKNIRVDFLSDKT